MNDNEKNGQLNFEVIFHKYYREMLAVAYKYLHNFSDAEDAVSKVFISLLNNPSILEGLDDKDLRARLLTLVKYRSQDLYRQISRNAHEDIDEHGLFGNPDRLNDAEGDIILLLEQMAEPHKSILKLKYLFGYTLAETGKLTNLSIAQVRRYLYEGKAWLKSAWSGEDDDVQKG